jgi:hypothetical protein
VHVIGSDSEEDSSTDEGNDKKERKLIEEIE